METLGTRKLFPGPEQHWRCRCGKAGISLKTRSAKKVGRRPRLLHLRRAGKGRGTGSTTMLGTQVQVDVVVTRNQVGRKMNFFPSKAGAFLGPLTYGAMWLSTILVLGFGGLSLYLVGISYFNVTLLLIGMAQLYFCRQNEQIALKFAGVEWFLIGLMAAPFLFPSPDSRTNPPFSLYTGIVVFAIIFLAMAWLSTLCFNASNKKRE